MLRNGLSPIPLKRQHLGNENCAALLASGHAIALPPIVNDIADALYWLQATESPAPLRSIYHYISFNLMRVCVIDGSHIHPLEAHYRLALISAVVMLKTIFENCVTQSIEDIKAYFENRWGERLSVVPFKDVILDFYNYCLMRKYLFIIFAC
jgi:hypothetical protein